MRLKKGFTLAEILIVLMVIGVVATMTIPSLMKGVTDAQYKTAYKKAFNAVVNIAAMENVSGNLPATKDASGVEVMYKTLKANLSVKDYVTYAKSNLNSGKKVALTDVDETDTALTSGATHSNWITTEDNISYLVMTVNEFKTTAGIGNQQNENNNTQENQENPSGNQSNANNKCGTKLDINSSGIDQACMVVIVDVNGVTSNPNSLDAQVTGVTENAQLNALEGDRFPIFIGKDGATAGSKKTTVTGRIVAELK